MDIREIIERADKAQPITEINGVKLTTYQDQTSLASAESAMGVGLDLPEFNPDGTIASTPTKWAAVNTEIFFDNRFRKVEDEYHVVCALKDYLALKGLKDGRLPYQQVTADVIVADKNGKPKYKSTVTVTDAEFVETFTDKFSREDMAKILPILMEGKGEPEAKTPIFK